MTMGHRIVEKLSTARINVATILSPFTGPELIIPGVPRLKHLKTFSQMFYLYLLLIFYLLTEAAASYIDFLVMCPYVIHVKQLNLDDSRMLLSLSILKRDTAVPFNVVTYYVELKQYCMYVL